MPDYDFYLDVSGTARERGLAHGEALRSVIQNAVGQAVDVASHVGSTEPRTLYLKLFMPVLLEPVTVNVPRFAVLARHHDIDLHSLLNVNHLDFLSVSRYLVHVAGSSGGSPSSG